MRLILALTLIAGPAYAQDSVYLVLLKGANALAYYSPEGKLQTSVAVNQHPHEMVFSADRRLLYTADNGTMRIEHPGKGGNSLSIIDVRARKKLGDISLGDYHRPHGIDLDKKTGRLVVTTELPDKLLLIDPVKKSVLKTYDTKGKTPHMVTLGPGGKWAYVSNSGSGTVAAVNLDTSEVKVIPTGERPEGAVLSPDGRELYVTNREAATISVINTATNEVSGTIRTSKGPVRIGVTPEGTIVYACMHDKRVAFADPKSRKETGHVPVNGTPVSLHVSTDGKLAFASGEEQDTIFVVSIADRKLLRSFQTAKGAGPDPAIDYPAR